MVQAKDRSVSRPRSAQRKAECIRDRKVKILLRSVLMSGLAASVVFPTCAKEPVVDCLSAAASQPDAVIADERFGNGVVGFVRAVNAVGGLDGNDINGKGIEVLRFRDDAGCAAEQVDTYHYEGGEPTLEASFTHTVQGESNLFTIVSWPLLHVGLGMNGRFYSVYAYHEVDGVLITNDLVVKNKDLYGGVEGTLEGEPSTFEGKTEEGVVAMLERLGLE